MLPSTSIEIQYPRCAVGNAWREFWCAVRTLLEVIGDALRFMKDRETNRQIQIEKLRQEIAIGIEQCQRGEVFDGEEVVQELLEEI